MTNGKQNLAFFRNTRANKDGENPKKKTKSKHYKEVRNCIKECLKVKKEEVTRKESSMAIADTSFVRLDFANIMHDTN